MKTNSLPSVLELLEPRLAPASLVNAHQVTYLDSDGDKVTVTTSEGTFTEGLFHFDSAFSTTGGQVLQMLDLSGGEFSLADLTVTVKQVAGGNGQVNLGYVKATNTDLGIVKINGDLGRIDAGDADTTTAAVKALKLGSMGTQGLTTQASGGTNVSNIAGRIGALEIKGNVLGASIFVTGNGAADGSIGKIKMGSLSGNTADLGEITATGDIGSVTLRGFLAGGDGDNSGRIFAGGSLGDVHIANFMIGGTGSHTGALEAKTSIGNIFIGGQLGGGGGNFSGNIDSGGSIGNIHIGQALDGSAGGARIHSVGDMGFVNIGGGLIGGDVKSQSGQIYAQGMIKGATVHGSLIGGSKGDTGELLASKGVTGKIKITGDVIGGTAYQSGYLSVGSSLKSLIIKGSLEGGGTDGDNSHGYVSILHDLKFLKIGGNIVGSDLSGSVSTAGTGYLQAGGKIGQAIIGGSIIAGTDTGSGTLNRSAGIFAESSIGSLIVKGDLIGNHASGGTTFVLIGTAGQNEQTPPVIGHLTVVGKVELANIIAGYQLSQSMNISNDSIGSVKIGKDWIESNLIAGALPGNDGKYGTADDKAGASTIAKIVVGGTVSGTSSGVNSSDHFGFVAGSVGAMSIGGKAVKLTVGQENLPVGTTGDVTVHETA